MLGKRAASAAVSLRPCSQIGSVQRAYFDVVAFGKTALPSWCAKCVANNSALIRATIPHRSNDCLDTITSLRRPFSIASALRLAISWTDGGAGATEATELDGCVLSPAMERENRGAGGAGRRLMGLAVRPGAMTTIML